LALKTVATKVLPTSLRAALKSGLSEFDAKTKIEFILRTDAQPVPLALPNGAPRAVYVLAFMWGAYFLNYCDRQVVSAVFKVLKEELSFSPTQQGLSVSLFLWVYGACCPLAGVLGDKVSKRLLVVMSLAVWSVVTIATGFSTSATMLLSLRAAMGVSEALYMPSAIALTTAAFPAARRSSAIAMLTTAQVMGTVAGSSFGGAMGDLGLWRWAFFGLGAMGILYALPLGLFLRGMKEEVGWVQAGRPYHNDADGAPAVRGAEVRTVKILPLMKIPSYALLCVVFPIFCFGQWLLYGWLPNFFEEKFSLKLGVAAWNATAFLQGAALIGILGGGVMADALMRYTKAGRFWLLVGSFIFCAPCVYLLGHCETLSATRAAAAGFGLFCGFLMGNIFPAAFEVVPIDARATAVGMLNFCATFLSGLGPLFGGVWKKTLGIDGLLSVTAVGYLVAGVALVVGIKKFLRKDIERTNLDLMFSGDAGA